MSLELLAAGTLLDMALGGIVGDVASEGAKKLWKTIRSRLVQNQPTIEAEIVEIEQNHTQEKRELIKAYLKAEMLRDNAFAEAISKLGHEIANTVKGDTIEQKDFEAENVIGKAEGNQQFFGGKHIHEKK